jgi:hypothetical protein
MLPAFLVSLALLGLSGLLIDSHRRSWRLADAASDFSAQARRFGLSQYRRRMQASSMIGLIGLAIGIGPLVPKRPGPMAFYLATLLAACAWIMLLALLDVLATRQHYRRLRGEQTTAQLKLAMELRAAPESADGESSFERSADHRCATVPDRG